MERRSRASLQDPAKRASGGNVGFEEERPYVRRMVGGWHILLSSFFTVFW